MLANLTDNAPIPVDSGKMLWGLKDVGVHVHECRNRVTARVTARNSWDRRRVQIPLDFLVADRALQSS